MNLNGKRIEAGKRTWGKVGQRWRKRENVRMRSGQLGVPGKREMSLSGEQGEQAGIFCEQEKTQKYTVIFQFLYCSGPSEQENPG